MRSCALRVWYAGRLTSTYFNCRNHAFKGLRVPYKNSQPTSPATVPVTNAVPFSSSLLCSNGLKNIWSFLIFTSSSVIKALLKDSLAYTEGRCGGPGMIGL
jgi:hypothetical protein